MADASVKSAIGVISGTSMDGIDVAWIETDGIGVVRPRGGSVFPYPAALRAELQDFLRAPERAEVDPLTELETRMTAAFGDAIEAFIAAEGLTPGDVDLIGLHGQTVFHRPERRFTRQLGNGALLRDRFGITVVDQFRLADVAAGGQGAPLAPLYHAALANALPQPLMVLNLGGVGNVTYIDGETIIAFDTGPASALIDDFVSRRFGVPFDDGGCLAAQGKIDTAVLVALMSDPYFDLQPPKSLDRNAFHARAAIVEALPPHDAVATLTAFTIEATAAAVKHIPKPAVRWLVCGGGRHNGALMEGFRQRLMVPVEPVEAVGWNGDLLEAELFGFLGVRALRRLPLSLPTTTGVARPMTGGRIWAKA